MDDIKALVAALRAGNYWLAFRQVVKLLDAWANEMAPVVLPARKAASLESLTDQLEAEATGLKAGSGQWLALLLQVLKALLPLILKEQG